MFSGGFSLFSLFSCFCVLCCVVRCCLFDAFDAGHFLGVGVFVFVDEEVEGALLFLLVVLIEEFVHLVLFHVERVGLSLGTLVVGESLHSVVFFLQFVASIDELEVGDAGFDVSVEGFLYVLVDVLAVVGAALGAVLGGRGCVRFFVDCIYTADGEEFFVRWLYFGLIFRMDAGLIVGGCIFGGVLLAVCFGVRQAASAEESGEFEESVVVEA